MASSAFGRKLNPYRRLRDPLGVKATRQTVVVTNNPATVDQNQQLLVRFPNLGADDVIVPGTARLAFTISLSSTDANRTLVQNIGRAICKRVTIRFSGNEIMPIDDSDVYYCYQDLWKTAFERENSQYQGIDTTTNRNATKLRVGAGDVENVPADKAISEAYGNRFFVPLDFEILESHMPFYQAGLGDRLEYELTFNEYGSAMQATADAGGSYTVENISLEFDKITNTELARNIRNQYANRLAILYERILRHRKLRRDKSDTLWNININTPARSMKGILLLFVDPAAAFQRDTEAFYNPKITKVEVTIEGVPNELYAQGLRAYQQWDEAIKFHASGSKRDPIAGVVAKDLDLADVSLPEYLTTKFSLWLDMRSSDDDRLHGTGRRIENASEGVTLQITKKLEAAGVLDVYVFFIIDAQLNLEDGRITSILY